ncbi:tetratricopeptide repeat protein [Shewanella submarina]|uniref:Tetratricopeptide repeat protein n=1 Tax=Shewanella submarina TaxID=2016376 RepID=A0ABV7GBJ1_9GAMM|nr:tetratricopeptide repeat protein [Shewanella submarina]MCL1037214.1 tetratricopeptide repeat protein [Shewanella submarina]
MASIFRLLVLILFIPVLCRAQPLTPTEKPVAHSNQTCINCHQVQAGLWQKSDHANAMATATKSSVLGDFSGVTATHYGQRARFFSDGNKLMAEVSYGDKSETLEVLYSFGYYPLQQYLVETGKGKLQVLPFAWDSRPTEEGGQSWYHNYSEEISPDDRLHWRQPLQNWNGMCADCHSDGLVRQYDVNQDSFRTQWDNINVGCISCHGQMPAHGKTSPDAIVAENISPNPMSLKNSGIWRRLPGQKIASWQGEKRDNSFMDSCFACHSLRTPLTDGFQPGKHFLDQFSPQLINAPMYHADGQIKEEVYVYGSFMQSKMARAGVNCLDCHDSHTMKLKAEGNGLCLQCHSPEHYNLQTHLQHQPNTPGGQCVDCHMPQTRYMGVDDRRDHSFSVPRPSHSANIGAPDACSGCHKDKDEDWATEAVVKLYGREMPLSASEERLHQLRAGLPLAANSHREIIDDTRLPLLSRASALELLPLTHESLPPEWLGGYLAHPEPLLRTAAANLGYLLSQQQRDKLLTPLLADKVKAVRIAAARSLGMDINTSGGAELSRVNQISSWRGEGRLNQALQLLANGRWQQAIPELRSSISTDPYFPPAYINLADIYRATRQDDKAAATFSGGLQHNPDSADLHYGYGLHLIRQKEYIKAETHLQQAYRLTPVNSQYLYVYLMALDHNGKVGDAVGYLQEYLDRYPASAALIQLGQSLARKSGNIKLYQKLRQQEQQ